MITASLVGAGVSGNGTFASVSVLTVGDGYIGVMGVGGLVFELIGEFVVEVAEGGGCVMLMEGSSVTVLSCKEGENVVVGNTGMDVVVGDAAAGDIVGASVGASV